MLLALETAKQPAIRPTREPESCTQERLIDGSPYWQYIVKIVLPVENGEPQSSRVQSLAVFERE
ncbi:hypothetical protein [Olivibacter domesticus]|uniref:Uncharacterized protein n=1 Tax=Olivibacter domesticus TaxID=407022 RepID=A0A1H7WPS1_OLID1|nr:hypothetical protein [Olivibacter domesticus]SEM23028.1 hypothetical protein SAMN05661044_04586 [Olivibacter domesticus]